MTKGFESILVRIEEFKNQLDVVSGRELFLYWCAHC